MKKILSLVALMIVTIAIHAQNPFFQAVNYRGAFAPAPTSPWTDGWVNWDPQNTEYGAGLPVLNVSGSITANRIWSSDTVYKLQGLVYVKSGATLTIKPGTIILGDTAVAQSSLVITKGSKINAVGNSSQPIVFSSSASVGLRKKGDWGGIIILGKSTLNKSGGIGNIEGIATSTDTEYGGGTNPDDEDNSGNLKYVRIEFGGYVFATDQEINGLTLGAVGRNTIIDYVQCSYINDDAFEWFGGTVNCSHLVAYKCLDDNFDTDNGYSGSVQFALGVRDPLISDQSSSSTSEGFESDNDACGSANTPKTSAVFSNVTDISGFRGTPTSSYASTFKFRRGARIRRNSNLKIFNSIMMDAPYGVFIDDAINTSATSGCSSPGFFFPVSGNIQSGATKFKNNIIAGCLRATEPTMRKATSDSLFSFYANDSLTSTSSLLTTPYDFTNPDYRPATGSLALEAAKVNFTDAAFTGRVLVVSAASSIREVSYRGAFAPAPAAMWTDGWTNWDPKNTTYPTPTVTISGNITTNTTWTPDNTYLISGLVYVNSGVTLTIKPGTVIRGLANTNSSLVVTKNAKLIAVGTVDSAIVFTSSNDAGSRNVGDWGGVILLGRASYNKSGGIGNIEGIAASTSTEFGGGATPYDDDNSGSLKYVRIEFGGYVFATDQEINGLTLGAVGRGTTIDYVQCSFINDDAFEWFGGTVNCSHLVAYRCLDDNFDTDNGYNGSVQFALGVRDPLISDQSASSTSEGFESDNDACGSANTPKTSALFTNVTDISGFRGTPTSSYATTFKFRRGARIRRNSNLKIFNSILMDAPYGVFIDDAINTSATSGCSSPGFNFPVSASIQTGKTKFKNNLVAGCLRATEPTMRKTLIDSLFSTGNDFYKNDSLTTTSGVLVNPYDFLSPDYRPGTQPLASTGAAFTDTAFNGLIVPCDNVSAPITMTGNFNIYGCPSLVQTYTVGTISNASYYQWTVSDPTKMSITAGQGSRTVTITYLSTFTTGTISVVGKNDCGNSSTPLTKSVVKTTYAGTLGSIVAPATPYSTNICRVIGRDTALTYSVAAVTGVTTYTWTAPTNAVITSGQGTRIVTIKFLSNYSFVAGDSLSVVATSGCVTSPVKKLAIKWTVPTAPTAITVTAVSIKTCGAKVYRYKAAALTTPSTGYEWTFTGTLGANAHIDSGTVNSQTILVSYTSNAAAAAGDSIKLRFSSSCGYSNWYKIKLTNTLLGAPIAPSSVTAALLPTTTCGKPRYKYTVLPLTLPIATTTAMAATGRQWYFGAGTVAQSAVIDSVVGNVAYVTYSSMAVHAAGDSIYVRYTSDCGYGTALKVALTNVASSSNAPATPASITAATVDGTTCGYRQYRYTAPVFPAGTATYSLATGCAWSFSGTLGANAVIDSGNVAGSNKILVHYTSNAASVIGDSVKVRYTSVCGTSAGYAKLKLTNATITCLTSGNSTSKATINTTTGAEVYPNPNNGNFVLNVKTGVTAKTTAMIQIVDMAGRVVAQSFAENNNGIILTNIYNNNLQNGMYIVRYTVGSVSNAVRMVVQK